MNGRGLSSTNFFTPRAIRRMVAGASGRFTPSFFASSFVRKIEGRDRPVDALRGSSPRKSATLAVSRRRPDDRLAVATRDQEQPLPDGRRAVIAGAQLAPFDHVAESLELPNERAERLTLARWARLPVFESTGPHVWNSSTFSSTMTRGRTAAAQRIATQASPRIFFETGFPPFAFEKCLQSGESHMRPTGRPAHASTGSTFQTSSARCSESGWFAAWSAIASLS
jgi:hypothetical protein